MAIGVGKGVGGGVGNGVGAGVGFGAGVGSAFGTSHGGKVPGLGTSQGGSLCVACEPLRTCTSYPVFAPQMVGGAAALKKRRARQAASIVRPLSAPSFFPLTVTARRSEFSEYLVLSLEFL